MVNKYFITALYVIAGCAVITPLSAQETCELIRRVEGRGNNIATVLKIIVATDETTKHVNKSSLSKKELSITFEDGTKLTYGGTDAPISCYYHHIESNPIRAPGASKARTIRI